MLVIKEVRDKEAELDALSLIKEYIYSLPFKLDFQDVEKELGKFPGEYSSESKGTVLLAYIDGNPVGVVALRKIENDICEMKRLYVKKQARGKGIGKYLSIALMERARELGYKKMRLDTLYSMPSAVSLYRSLGFYEISPYRYNPLPDALFMEADLCSK